MDVSRSPRTKSVFFFLKKERLFCLPSQKAASPSLSVCSVVVIFCTIVNDRYLLESIVSKIALHAVMHTFLFPTAPYTID